MTIEVRGAMVRLVFTHPREAEEWVHHDGVLRVADVPLAPWTKDTFVGVVLRGAEVDPTHNRLWWRGVKDVTVIDIVNALAEARRSTP